MSPLCYRTHWTNKYTATGGTVNLGIPMLEADKKIQDWDDSSWWAVGWKGRDGSEHRRTFPDRDFCEAESLAALLAANGVKPEMWKL
jgi:hypothetical protein